MLSSARCGLTAAWRGVGVASVRVSQAHAPPRLVASAPLPTVRCLSAVVQQHTERERAASGPEDEHDGRVRDLERAQRRRKGSNWDYGVELSALAARLGHSLATLPSLRGALCLSPSTAFSAKPPVEERRSAKARDAERMSRLGQVLLHFFVEEHLFHSFPKLEGDHLHDLHCSLTHSSTLARIAGHVGVNDLLITTHEEIRDGVSSRGFKAVLAAVYLDCGLAGAKRLVHELVLPQLAETDIGQVIKTQHPKFVLRAILLGMGKPPPVSRLVRESGRATHFPSFVVGMFSGQRLLAEGCGTSLKRAEREAANAALQKHFQSELSRAPLPFDSEDFQPENRVVLMEKKEKEREGEVEGEKA